MLALDSVQRLAGSSAAPPPELPDSHGSAQFRGSSSRLTPAAGVDDCFTWNAVAGAP